MINSFRLVLLVLIFYLSFLKNSFAISIEEEAFLLLKEFIRVNTVNPPGNEILAVNFYATIFEKEGIEYEVVESLPGRGNIWARLKGGGKPRKASCSHQLKYEPNIPGIK